MTKWVVYVDKDDKKKIRKSDESLKKEVEIKETKNRENNERMKRQEEYINNFISLHSEWNLNLIRRFFSKVDIRGEDECWNWITAINFDGYGHFWVDSKVERAHRFSYILQYGKLSDKINVLHNCDNPRCVNPKHLFLGTQNDNIKDCINKDRLSSKITKEIANKIRNEYINNKSLKMHDISKKYGISFQEVSFIMKNERWKDDNYNPKIRTGQEGENSPNSKLNWTQVRDIREKHKNGTLIIRLKEEYKVSYHTIYRIVHNITWIQ